MVGEGSSAPDDGGSVNGITLAYNTISQSTSDLQLDRDIKNIVYTHNTFNNSNGYMKLDKPTPGGTGLLQGITVTYNTFNNSTKPFADEYAVLVFSTLSAADANNNWGDNLAIHFNNILQDNETGNHPIVGFQDSFLSAGTSEITATHNWWNSTDGPRIFAVSQKVGFDNFSLAPITGGVVAIAHRRITR